jgi:class 3 adenylate cyclase
MGKWTENIFGKKINKTRIVPITLKIVIIFALFILASNLTSSYINLMFNRSELIDLMKNLLIKDLKDIYNFSNNQFEIYQFNNDFLGSVKSIEQKSVREFRKKRSIALGIREDGSLMFVGSNDNQFQAKEGEIRNFSDPAVLMKMNELKAQNKLEDFITFDIHGKEYFGVYKYNQKWGIYILRGEEENEFYENSRTIFKNISIIIIILTVFCAIIGIYLLRHTLRFVNFITTAIMKMNEKQQLELINLDKAPNDDITFLGVAFNSLSSTINNLVNIFRKFANKDVAIKAYRDREVKLEGAQRDLTCLFSDIKSFTYMTETLGTNIITLLNLHYDKAIRKIIELEGTIGSIIGDAILSVYGIFEDSSQNKSYQAILSAYEIQNVAEELRFKMTEVREEIVLEKGALSESEERVYKAVLIEVGVGIDGGNVFYGNIGSYERMTNTVIGDTVNSASRLEGLTRIYKVPVICSEYIVQDIQKNVPSSNFVFVELDTVQVKGKTIGKKIFWPIQKEFYTEKLQQELQAFSQGLNFYYEGKWKEAIREFSLCSLPSAEVFINRIKDSKVPEGWNGIWAMNEK